MQKIYNVLFFAAIISLFLAAALLAGNCWYIYQHHWLPLQLDVPMQTGAVSQGHFVAQRDHRYEIELEFAATLPEKELMELVTKPGTIADFSLSWKVFSQNTLLAQGTSNQRLYYATGGRSFLGQVKRLLLSNPFHKGQGSVVRGIGQFRGQHNQEYQLQITAHAVNKQLSSTHPKINVRPGRLFWQRYTQSSMPLAYIGIGLLALGILFGATALLLKLVLRKKN